MQQCPVIKMINDVIKIPTGLPNLNQPICDQPVDLLVYCEKSGSISFQKLGPGNSSMYELATSVDFKLIAKAEACRTQHNVQFYYSDYVSVKNIKNVGEFEHFTLEGTGRFDDAVFGKLYKNEDLWWYVKFTKQTN